TLHTGTASGSGCSGIRVSAYPWAGLGSSSSLGLLTRAGSLGARPLSGFSSILATQNGPQRSVNPGWQAYALKHEKDRFSPTSTFKKQLPGVHTPGSCFER